jgi:Tol biopolymer transport system component
VTIDSTGHQAIGPTDTLDLLVPGGAEHVVELTDIAVNCGLSGDSARTVASGGDTTKVDFQVSCEPEAGVLRVTTVTTGIDVDPNGYTVVVDDTPFGTIDVTGDYSVNLPTGTHVVTLAGVTHNCHLAEADSRTTTLVAGATSQVAISLSCESAPPAGAGHELAFVSNRSPDELHGIQDRVYLMNDEGTGVRALLGVPNKDQRRLSWLPGGQQLNFIASRYDAEAFAPNDVDILDLASDDLRTVLTGPYFFRFQWSPDGLRLAYTKDLEPFPDSEGEAPLQVFVADADGSNARQLGPRDLLRWSPTWAPDGTRLAFVRSGPAGQDIAISPWDRFDEAPVPAELPDGIFIDDLTWSPQGNKLLFSAILPDIKSYIYVINTDGNGLARLTQAQGREGDYNPTWSPDGTKIAFHSDRDGNFEIYVMNADGSEQTRLTNNPADDIGPAWRP